MNAGTHLLALPSGWTGTFDLEHTEEGTYEGLTQLSLGGVKLCSILIPPAASCDGAIQDAYARASRFVRQWCASLDSEQAPL